MKKKIQNGNAAEINTSTSTNFSSSSFNILPNNNFSSLEKETLLAPKSREKVFFLSRKRKI